MTVEELKQKGIKIKTEEIVLELLNEKYFNEFQIIDGINQHPLGFNFFQWLVHNKFIE